MSNREIKFRVWNKRTNNWVHGPGHEINLFGETILLGGFMRGIGLEELNDCVALQYTGMKDKNGKEIYEGDFVSVVDENNIFDIRFGKVKRTVVGIDAATLHLVEINCFYFHRDGFPYFSITYNFIGKHDLDDTKIIGNIFQNKNLLK